jgi:hypothetical protein
MIVGLGVDSQTWHLISTTQGILVKVGIGFYTKICKSKDKIVFVLLTEHHAMKAYRGSGGIEPLIL